MGVPKFFRWISERYPCLSELVKEHQIPSFDNLYLDMNGIIHMCSHPNDHDPHFRISEEKICKDIFHYIEILFQMIKPQKLFFMAVDGVAPRAKQNQQRGRRFRTAKDAELVEKRAKDKGEALPDTARFDSNCITPGTVFMTRLQEELKYYVAKKISDDSDWQRCKIILSGHETPGEGEHKIMDYIRYMKSQPSYDPNTRHCLYGLDADLIMLGLCSHEPHFALLREEVKFGKGNHDKRISTPEETTFYLLHLSLMREYLEIEFNAVKKDLPFPFDLESVIDDWVLMGFLVGNDFIPPLPDMHISEGALPTLYQVYMKVLPTLNGYINEKGTLNLLRFQKYMEKLAQFDINQFQDNYADLMYFQAKTGQSSVRGKKQANNLIDLGKTRNNKELDLLIQSTNDMYLASSEDEEEFMTDEESAGDGFNDVLMMKEFRQHKNDYYMNKLEYKEVTPDVMREQAECYVRAIQWNLHYYYNGVCSWSWFYPHHYAPFASDIKDFADLELEYNMGTPFLPFQQLLAVLPSASKELLPDAFQYLMVSEDSPIIDYYPLEFSTDLNGKKQDWEALVLIPFIDETVLLSAMEKCYDKLTPDEKQRNKHGPMCVFTYSKGDLEGYPKTLYNPGFAPNHAKLQLVSREEIFVEQSKLVKGLCPNIDMETYLPGFPTFRHIPYSCEYRMKQVKVFESPSRGENAIVCIKHCDTPALAELAIKTLGKSIYVFWPHLVEARVISISSGEVCYTLEKDNSDNEVPTPHALSPADKRTWSMEAKSIAELYLKRRGVDVGSTAILVAARLSSGRRYIFSPDGKVELVKQWVEVPSYFVLQATVLDLPVYDQTIIKFNSLSEVFPVGMKCFLICTTIGVDNRTLYGQMGEVLEGGKPERVKVRFPDCIEPDLTEAKKKHYSSNAQFMAASQAAARLGISAHLLSRITGNIFVTPDLDPIPETDTPRKVNIALHLKYSSKNEQIPGYTRRDPNGNSWLYSMKTVELVGKYIEAFTDLVEYLSNHLSEDETLQSRLFPQSPGRLHEIVAWLKNQEYTKLSPQPCGCDAVEEEVVKVIEQIVEENLANQPRKFVKMSAKPSLLYTPDLTDGVESADASTTFRLFDRVINCRKSCSVPLGLKGVIIGIYKNSKDSVVNYDVVFDKSFPSGLTLNCSDQRGYRLPGYYLINISHGIRMDQGDDKTQLIYTPVLPSLKPIPNQRPTVPNATVFNELGERGPLPVHEIPKTPGRKITKENQPVWRTKQTFQSEVVNQISTQNKETITILSRNQGVNAAAGGTVTNGVAPNVMPLPTDFQALWMDLEKKQPAPPPEDPSSSALRQILRIPGNGGTQQVAQINQANNNSNNEAQQPAVLQQIFKQWPVQPPVPSNIVLSESTSVCGQLLSLFQARNLGTPRYNYVENHFNKTFQATVKLPDGRSFMGQPCTSKEKASELAAREAFEVLCREPMAVPPIPPAQWCAPPTVSQVPSVNNGKPAHVMHHKTPTKYPTSSQQASSAKNGSNQIQGPVQAVPFLPHFAQSPQQRPSQSLQQSAPQASFIPPFLQLQGGGQPVHTQAPKEFDISHQTQPPSFVQPSQSIPIPPPHKPPMRQSPQQASNSPPSVFSPSQQSAQFAQAMQQVLTQGPLMQQQFTQPPPTLQFPNPMQQGKQSTPVHQQQQAPYMQPQSVIQPPSRQAQYAAMNQNSVEHPLGFMSQARNVPTAPPGSVLFPHNQMGQQQQQYRPQNAAFAGHRQQMQHMQQIFPPRTGVVQPSLFPGAQQAFPMQALNTKPFTQQSVRIQSVPSQQNQLQMPFVPLQAVKQQRKEATHVKQTFPKSKQQSDEMLQPTLPVVKPAAVPSSGIIGDATAPPTIKPVSRKICANFSGLKKKKKKVDTGTQES